MADVHWHLKPLSVRDSSPGQRMSRDCSGHAGVGNSNPPVCLGGQEGYLLASLMISTSQGAGFIGNLHLNLHLI